MVSSFFHRPAVSKSRVISFEIHRHEDKLAVPIAIAFLVLTFGLPVIVVALAIGWLSPAPASMSSDPAWIFAASVIFGTLVISELYLARMLWMRVVRRFWRAHYLEVCEYEREFFVEIQENLAWLDADEVSIPSK
jgi:uncharacterized membrane protein (DUF485 family)